MQETGGPHQLLSYNYIVTTNYESYDLFTPMLN